MRRNRIPPMEQPAPKPKAVVLKVTKEQIVGIQSRNQQILQAQQGLNDFVSGIVAGHGHDRVQVTAFDPEQLTVTIDVLPKAGA